MSLWCEPLEFQEMQYLSALQVDETFAQKIFLYEDIIQKFLLAVVQCGYPGASGVKQLSRPK